MNIKRNISILLTATMLLSAGLTGCGKNSDTAKDTTEDTTETAISEKSGESKSGTTANSITIEASGTDIYAKVTGVDGSRISFETTNIPGGMDMDELMGDTSQMPGENSNQETPPDMPEGGTTDGNMPGKPDGENGQGGNTQQGTPPEMPEGGTDGNAPEKPDGENGQGGMTGGQMPDGEGGQGGMQVGNGQGNAPEMPDGDSPGGDASGMEGMEMPDMEGSGESGTLTLSDTSVLYKSEDGKETVADIADITEGCILKISFDNSGNIEKILISDETEFSFGGDMAEMGQGGQMPAGGQGGSGMGGGSSSAPSDYEAVSTYSEDAEISGEALSSTGSDENAVLVTGGSVSISNVTVDRTSSDSTGGDNSSFYGVGAAILCTDGTVEITDSTITTSSAGGAGVFAYGSGTVTVSDTTITTQQGTSGGIHAAGGGTLYAEDLTVTTAGESSAAIRSDRGGGTMRVSGGSYTSNGTGSPAIYCTADIAVKDADLTATNSEAICIEGKNSLLLYDCTLTGDMPDQSGNDSTWTIIVYQSMSGDAEVGSGTFQMVGGKLISENGGIFYTTNTTSHIILSDVDIEACDDSEYLLACLGNSNSRGWGTSGNNGADCTFTAIDQELEGTVLWDSISELKFYLIEGSEFTGSIEQDESCAGNGGSGYCSVYISSDSKWIVDADSTVTNLYNAGTITDASGKTVSIVGTDGTVYVKGSGSITITVESYSTGADLTGADAVTAESDIDFKKNN